MAPLEPWEKVLVDGVAFPETEHGKLTCIECHAGANVSDKEMAHDGMIASPSAQPELVCGECHEEQTVAYAKSLHNTQAGYWTAINTRNGNVPEDHAKLQEMFGNHCATCHTTCGECHVSQPENVGGGLFTGHVFERTPPMTRSCTACHGSRVGNEFLGKNEGIPGDVHFREARLSCVKCHESAELHGMTEDTASAGHRLNGAQGPECIDCHETVGSDDGVFLHKLHGDTLSCQVCHSVTYTSCDGCHVAVSETSGNPYFETEATYMTFLIGRNPIQSEERPYKFVPVRHVPSSSTSYEFYGEGLLTNFDALPTWVYSTPHNIQRNTPQTASCEACHNNPAIFLTADKVKPDELNANVSVIVNAVPASADLFLAAVPQPAGHAELVSNGCTSCHIEGIRGAPLPPESHTGFVDESCTSCHELP